VLPLRPRLALDKFFWLVDAFRFARDLGPQTRPDSKRLSHPHVGYTLVRRTNKIKHQFIIAEANNIVGCHIKWSEVLVSKSSARRSKELERQRERQEEQKQHNPTHIRTKRQAKPHYILIE
jgi:hypothetical protein